MFFFILVVFRIVVDFKFMIIDIGFDVIFICVWVGNFFFIFIWIKKDLNMVRCLLFILNVGRSIVGVGGGVVNKYIIF